MWRIIYIYRIQEAVSAILTADDEEICSIIGKASDEQTIKIIDIESALIGRIKSYGMVDDAKVIVSFNGKMLLLQPIYTEVIRASDVR